MPPKAVPPVFPPAFIVNVDQSGNDPTLPVPQGWPAAYVRARSDLDDICINQVSDYTRATLYEGMIRSYAQLAVLKCEMIRTFVGAGAADRQRVYSESLILQAEAKKAAEDTRLVAVSPQLLAIYGDSFFKKLDGDVVNTFARAHGNPAVIRYISIESFLLKRYRTGKFFVLAIFTFCRAVRKINAVSDPEYHKLVDMIQDDYLAHYEDKVVISALQKCVEKWIPTPLNMRFFPFFDLNFPNAVRDVFAVKVQLAGRDRDRDRHGPPSAQRPNRSRSRSRGQGDVVRAEDAQDGFCNTEKKTRVL